MMPEKGRSEKGNRMNIYVQIRQCLEEFSVNEKKLADYLLAHPDRVLPMTADRLAGELYISKSAVYRFCDKMKLAGYGELKRRLAADLYDYMHEKEFDYDFPVQKGQSMLQIVSGIKEDYLNTIDATMDYVRTDQIAMAVAGMRRAKEIDIFTSAGNIFIAQNFAFQMQEIGIRVNVPVEEYRQKLLAASADRTHFGILITFEGRGAGIKSIASILHENKVPLLLICSPNMKDIESDYILYFSPHEDHADKVSSFSRRLSLLFLLDMLYAGYFAADYDNNLEKRKRFYQKMTRYT